MAGFNQFNQHSGTAGGMNKDVAMAASTDLDVFGHQADTVFF